MTVILCNLSDANKVINEEREYWISDVLDTLEIPDAVFDATDIDDFRARMEEQGVEVQLSTTGDVDVYRKEWFKGSSEESSGWLPPTEEHLVGQWREPKRIKKIDKTDKSVYYEIHLNEWSIK